MTPGIMNYIWFYFVYSFCCEPTNSPTLDLWNGISDNYDVLWEGSLDHFGTLNNNGQTVMKLGVKLGWTGISINDDVLWEGSFDHFGTPNNDGQTVAKLGVNITYSNMRTIGPINASNHRDLYFVYSFKCNYYDKSYTYMKISASNGYNHAYSTYAESAKGWNYDSDSMMGPCIDNSMNVVNYPNITYFPFWYDNLDTFYLGLTGGWELVYGKLFGTGPSPSPTISPTSGPSDNPTTEPSNNPTSEPSSDPTPDPSIDPTNDPSKNPTTDPTMIPSQPTEAPTITTSSPTTKPTMPPTFNPSKNPTTDPTIIPTFHPTLLPSISPTQPTTVLTNGPTSDPLISPTDDPTTQPTEYPSVDPSVSPTINPTTSEPTLSPSDKPTSHPTPDSSLYPSNNPTQDPTTPFPTSNPTNSSESAASDTMDSKNENDSHSTIIITVGCIVIFGLIACILYMLLCKKDGIKLRKESDLEKDMKYVQLEEETDNANL